MKPESHRKSARIFWRFFLFVACTPPMLLSWSPASAVNRCTDAKGKVTFQDAACDAAATAKTVDTSEAFSAKPKSTIPAQGAQLARPNSREAAPGAEPEGYATARGVWRGPVQFHISVGGVRDMAAQAVKPAVLEIRPTGEVLGIIVSAGCKVSGLAREFVTSSSVSLDVSLKDCVDPRFNTRFTGHLISSAKAMEASLQLNAITMPIFSGKVQQASLDAVFKR